MISYTIQSAKQFQNKFNNVSIELSTDSEEIIRVAEISGLKSDYRRPDSLAGDSIGKIDAIKDVLIWKEKANSCQYDYILDMDVTSPLRNLKDLTDAFEIIQKNRNALNLFSVNPSNRSPYFNMVEQKDNGFFAQVKQHDGLVLSRQSAPKVYDMNASFYFYKRSFFELGYKSAITDKSIVYEMPHICFDIDQPIDFEIISYLIERKKLDFPL